MQAAVSLNFTVFEPAYTFIALVAISDDQLGRYSLRPFLSGNNVLCNTRGILRF
jgi:hypothetical protein